MNHRPLKGKEDGISNFAYTFCRPNPANCYRFENSTATSLILPLKNPQLVLALAKPRLPTYHLKKSQIELDKNISLGEIGVPTRDVETGVVNKMG